MVWSAQRWAKTPTRLYQNNNDAVVFNNVYLLSLTSFGIIVHLNFIFLQIINIPSFEGTIYYEGNNIFYLICTYMKVHIF